MKVFVQTLWLVMLGTSVMAQGLNPVTVVSNQTDQRVSYWFFPDTSRQQIKEPKSLDPGESAVLPNPEGRACIVFQHKGKPAKVILHQDKIHAFFCPKDTLELYRLGPDYLGSVASLAPPVFSESQLKLVKPILTLKIRLYQDEDIPLAPDLWEQRTRERIQKASEILERTCFVRLEVVGVETWKSKPDAKNMTELMQHFEKVVPLNPRELSVGFTSNRVFAPEGTQLGVARAPFHPRILLREEAPQITEVERLETLLHELGHFLGAVHTSDANSLMRSAIRERRSREASFAISFDPLNALAMNLWCRQFLRKQLTKTQGLDEDLRLRLLAVYDLMETMAQQQRDAGENVPENPNLALFQKILKGVEPEPEPEIAVAPGETKPEPAPELEPAPEPELTPEEADASDPLGIRKIRESRKEPVPPEPEAEPEPIVTPPVELAPPVPMSPASEDLKKLYEMREVLAQNPWKTEEVTKYTLPARTTQFILVSTLIAYLEDGQELKSDALGERLTRYAASIALEVGGSAAPETPEGKIARQSFLLAIGVFLEPSGTIYKVPIYGRRFRALETREFQELRRKYVKEVAIFNRGDWSMHFWLSAALATHLAPSAVENIGLEKERADDRIGGSGFDITDLNADFAGVGFSTRVMSGEIPLTRVAERFTYKSIVPTKITVPKNLKHPVTNEETVQLMKFLRDNVTEVQGAF